MAATRINLLIWEDGKDEAVKVTADQRDLAAFEVEFKMGANTGMTDMPVRFSRFVAWHALRRTGKLAPGTKQVDWDKNVVEVEQEGDEEGVDPGSTAASDETSSTSR